jgi:pyridinium-3,5-bisthiocarboxylic acid mononucleotide nickel chelatase
MKILYYDCFSGISGDMHLGAMIDIGVDQDRLLGELKKLDIDPYEIRITKDQRKGIGGTKVDVILSDKQEHHHRSFRDISELIEESGLSHNVITLSLKIFTTIAQVEAKIHGCAVDDVHFHEIGAVDSIVDIVGAAICLEDLNVDRIFSSPVQVGGGFVTCAHGRLPVPAPATVEILRGIPIKSGLVPFETTTPTGAAILVTTVDHFTETINFTPRKIGYGVGHRDTDIPNVLRIYLGDMAEEAFKDDDDGEIRDAVMIECNIDDMNPELYDDVMEALFEKGAHDVFLTPVIMKKSRPAVKISVLCGEEERKTIETTLLLRTSTLGVRTSKVTKTMLKRDFSKISTKYGEITVKNAYYQGKKIKSKPEYETCKKLAREKGVTVQDIYDSLKSGDR